MANQKVFTDMNEILDIVIDVYSDAEYDIGNSDFDSDSDVDFVDKTDVQELVSDVEDINPLTPELH